MFQVFVDGPVDRSPDGFERLARAMHRRYGLPVAGLVARLQQGRFRVKANIDRRTADAYARDLERIGARVLVEEVGAPRRSAPLPATSGELSTFDAGDVDSSLLVLATDDGPGAPSPTAGSPPPEAAPLDLLEPPDAGAARTFDLAPDDLEHQARKRAAAPLPSPAVTSPPPLAAAAPVGAAPSAPMPRARFAAGVVLAVVLGFVPAHLVASARERSAFRQIDDHVAEVQARTDEPLDAAALDAFRAEQLARKQSQRRSIALASLAIWAVVGGGLAYVWFRRIPWDRLAAAR
jgi:hypothetical protein